jgi:hypothetical protein
MAPGERGGRGGTQQGAETQLSAHETDDLMALPGHFVTESCKDTAFMLGKPLTGRPMAPGGGQEEGAGGGGQQSTWMQL